MLKELIDIRAIAVDVAARDKEAVLRRAADLLTGTGKDGPPAAEVYERLIYRESLGSTGIGEGIAIPHATDDDLDDFRLAVITVPGGVDFDAVDQRPVRVVFAMIGPADKRSRHVGILAALSRLSKEAGLLDALTKAESPKEAARLLDDGDAPNQDELQTVEKSLLIALVQDESFLEPLLEVLASVAGAGITVLDSHGVGRYLHSVPLFSMFWSDEGRRNDVRTVMAIIDRHVGNDTIRRISATVADPATKSGLLVALQPLALVSGSLEF